MRRTRLLLCLLSMSLSTLGVVSSLAQGCPRPQPGSIVVEPAALRSQGGLLQADLTALTEKQPDGAVRFCFVDAQGHQSPTLRVSPGDQVVLRLRNGMAPDAADTPPVMSAMHHQDGPPGQGQPNTCAPGAMGPLATNLHFHGLTVPPVCHQDDVMRTTLAPGDPVFEYNFRIPPDESPGLYWYHPHIHGFSKSQILGGASGALIVEGLERARPEIAGLPERLLILRDQDLLNPHALPSRSEPVVPKNLIDHDGDAANNGTGFGRPAKDLSINYVPVPFPNYPPAGLRMHPGQREVWRVLNASAITYLNLALLFGGAPQPLQLLAVDGSALGRGGTVSSPPTLQTHLGLPPGARMEFIVEAPPAGETGLLVTRTVDTGPGGENDPNRALARITVSADAPDPPSRLPSTAAVRPQPTEPWLGEVAPTRVRHLYFSEKLADPNNPTSAVEFYLTVDGQTPRMFNMNDDLPNIVAQQGTVEDWIIENRSNELHAFHIHQLHFLVMEYRGNPVEEDFLRDTVNVPFDSGHALLYPSVRVRMDFRDPNIVGTFPYHCHLLEHEDRGMMGLIKVLPAAPNKAPATISSAIRTAMK